MMKAPVLFKRETGGVVRMIRFWGKSASVGIIAAIFALHGAAFGAMSSPRIKPAAPGPEFLTRLDHARLLTMHAALEKKQFSLARSESSFITDPTAKSLGQWLYLMAKDEDVDIAEAGAFLDAHPDWPATDRIQSFVEGQISDTTPPATILDFFSARTPRTGDGKMQLARALLSAGRNTDAAALIKDAWVNHNFSLAKERRIIAAHKSRLTKEDHAARVDRLLWAIQVTNARRTFPQLSSKDRRMAEARAALLMRASTAPRLFRNLPQAEQRDAGVLHAAVRYYRRTNQQDKAIALAANAPDTPEALRNAGRWWTERRILAQWALKEGRFSDAYALAAQHGGAAGTQFSDAEFFAGWIALRFLGAPTRATTHFEAMTGAVATPISLSRGYYWLGRAAAAENNDVAARGYYSAAADYHYSYYGQLAAEALGVAAAKTFEAPPPINPADKALFNSRPAVAALRMLSDLNLDRAFMIFAYHIDDGLQRPGEYLALAEITNGEGAPHLTVRAGKVATRRGAFTPDVAYPAVFVPDEARAFVAPEIILGLSRQESEFNPRAFSSAGARGVMQLIPSTAQITARKEGLPYRRSALLDDPVYNMTLGSAHLSHLLDRFDGSLIMTFAAYNAGAQRANQWAEDFGDPRSSEVDPVDWVELIPFSETRNYVQRVLENVQVYRGRLDNEPIPGRLGADIERGGPRGRIAAAAIPSRRLEARAQLRTGANGLADLPAQTALNAAAFRDKRRAAMTAPMRNAVRPAAPTIEEADINTASPIAHAPGPQSVAKTENIVTPQTPAPSPAAPAQAQPGAAPTTAPDAIARLVATVTADTPPLAPASAEPLTVPDQTKSDFAERIVEKAATRLQIEDEGEALAAAIVRGLEQMEAESAPTPAPTPAPGLTPNCHDLTASAGDGDGGDGDRGDDASSLNALMAAQLRGDDACAE